MATSPILSPELQAIEREHQRSIRIIEARPMLQRFGVLFAIVVDSAMLIFFAFFIIGYIVSDSFTELRAATILRQNIAAMHSIAKGSVAQPLSVGTAKVIQGTSTNYDFYTIIKNPNAAWFATFTYSFTAGGLSSRSEDGFVMPGEDKYIVSLGVKSDHRLLSPALKIDNLIWHRIDHHIAPNVSSWLEQHGNFLITTPTFTADLVFGTNTIGRTTFGITNASAYSYWAPQFTVVLERAGAVVGVSKATLSQFVSGEIRSPEVRWYGDLPLSATATVTPDINYFDEESYMSPRGIQGFDPRDLLK